MVIIVVVIIIISITIIIMMVIGIMAIVGCMVMMSSRPLCTQIIVSCCALLPSVSRDMLHDFSIVAANSELVLSVTREGG